jgi:sugar phosphate isomerase/epimerase
MNLALSNFAWDFQDSEITFKTLKENNINQIETVFTKIKDWSELTTDSIIEYKKYIESFGITSYSAQSLFYNVKCNDINDVDVIISHFQKLIDYSKILGIKILVFGSPGLRKKNGNWKDSLTHIFKSVDEMLVDTGIKVLIEPNTSSYGGEFFHTVSEIVNFIDSNGLKNIRTMIDTHNSLLEKEDPNIELITYFDYINHIHVSEPKLRTIEETEFHLDFSDIIKKLGYDKTITYEVMKCDNILENIPLFSKIYK